MKGLFGISPKADVARGIHRGTEQAAGQLYTLHRHLRSFLPRTMQSTRPLPSSERKRHNSVLLMNVLNKLHFHGKPSTASNGCTHTIRRTSEVNELVYQGNDFFAARLYFSVLYQ